MIVILGHSEIDIQVSDADIRTMGSNNYKEVSGDDRDANDVLAAI